MREKKEPIRMCIICRKRIEQKKLLRLQEKDKRVVLYQGSGRSFYLCKDCIEKKLYLNKKRVKRVKIDLSTLEELVEGVKI